MAELYKTENYLDPVLVVKYVFDSDVHAVYQAWTDIDIFKKWFLPLNFTNAKAEMDAVEGGYFIIHMKSPQGDIYPTKGEYILLESPKRIVYKDSWDDERPNNEPVTTEITFSEMNGQTVLKLFSSFATLEQKEKTVNSGVVDGWKMFFDNLNKILSNQ